MRSKQRKYSVEPDVTSVSDVARYSPYDAKYEHAQPQQKMLIYNAYAIFLTMIRSSICMMMEQYVRKII